MTGALQLEPVSAEGVGINNLRAGLYILTVDAGDDLRLLQTEQCRIVAQLNALLLQHSAEAAV